VAKKKTAKKSKKPSGKSSTKAVKAKTARKPAGKAVSKTVRKKTNRPSLPRPTITAEEKLFLLFKENYHARQIFDFLRVETVGELEQFAADDIVKRLSRPVVESVERIRRRLAEKNRYLAGDEKYLLKIRDEAAQ
jgi:hypothetical protein